MSDARVDVVVVSFNRRELLARCCESVAALGEQVHLIVVDNASEDGSADMVQQRFPEASLIRSQRNLGFGGAANRGAAAGNAELLLFLNSDAQLLEGGYEALASALLSNSKTAAVGPHLADEHGRTELSVGRTLSLSNEAWFKILGSAYEARLPLLHGIVDRRYERARQTRSLSAACLLLRREAFDQLGGFDERFFLYAEDVDLCLRLVRAGWHLRYVSEARVRHRRGASAAVRPLMTEHWYRRSQIAFYEKHRSRLALTCLRVYLRVRYALLSRFGDSDRRQRAQAVADSLRGAPDATPSVTTGDR
ncbi:MAG TPA: glycosyltransferase family 2 protein [Acidobacteriota bacterium]|nr:glycosyltransferase family 2 protein [Acidobacteriota bacterium]